MPPDIFTLLALLVALAGVVGGGIAVLRSYRVRAELRQTREHLQNALNQLQTSMQRCQDGTTALQTNLTSCEANAQKSASIQQNFDARLTELTEKHQQLTNRLDNLHYESFKMTYLPFSHPDRVRLTHELQQQLAPVQAKLDLVLFPNQTPLGELDWMRKLKTKKFPYSLTDEEGLVLHKLVADCGFREGYEIATAFGYSSLYLGLAFKKTGGRLVTVDAYVEESEENFLYSEDTARERAARFKEALVAGRLNELPEGLQFAAENARVLGLQDIIQFEIAFSPDGIPPILNNRLLDFAFIDGGHFGEQPILDVNAVLPNLCKDRFALVFHDTQCEAVAKAVYHAAAQTSGSIFSIHTRNRLVVVSRGIDTEILQSCRDVVARQFL